MLPQGDGTGKIISPPSSLQGNQLDIWGASGYIVYHNHELQAPVDFLNTKSLGLGTGCIPTLMGPPASLRLPTIRFDPESAVVLTVIGHSMTLVSPLWLLRKWFLDGDLDHYPYWWENPYHYQQYGDSWFKAPLQQIPSGSEHD